MIKIFREREWIRKLIGNQEIQVELPLKLIVPPKQICFWKHLNSTNEIHHASTPNQYDMDQ